MPLHVLVAAQDEMEGVERAASRRRSVRWKVPKEARRGDEAAVFLRGQGFFGLGRIASQPSANRTRRGSYVASVDSLEVFPKPVPESRVSWRVPEWSWLSYPRSYTTPPAEVAARLRSLFQRYRPDEIPDVDELEVEEGDPHLRTHLVRERNRSLIERKKRSVLKRRGRLGCEVCGLDFHEVYGARGEGFCEVHHLAPLASSSDGKRTALSDLAIVCSNCHRMLHRGELIPLRRLKKIVSEQRAPQAKRSRG